MVPRLLLALALWAGRSSCRAGEATAQPRVQCRAPRYPLAVDCSWDLPPPAPDSAGPPTFVATYRLGLAPRGESWPCAQAAPEAASCSIAGLRLFSPVPYVLNVTTLHGGSSLTAFVAENIIKPDPPEAVRLSPLPGQRLRVQWAPPRSWPLPDVFPLKYWVRYRRPGAARFCQVGPTEATSVTLRALRPGARYQVQVAAQDITDAGEASDWSPPVAAP
ncbi:interleukin-27 subunit beta [Oryctolagus cuniculus]|uniref:interleukin-27 subunit beta n=1 Tax=Oryctolagus cuniculus TaxID=9986 RepID=UPI0038792262